MSLRPSDSVINASKKAVDKLGALSQDARFFLETLDPQQKNQFQILVSPEVATGGSVTFADRALQAAKSVLDTKVFSFFIQNLDIPIDAIEYTRHDSLQAVQDVAFADDVNFTFIEDESCVVRTFLQNWMSLSFKRDIVNGGYLFNDNQYLARKKIIILPLMRTGIPNTVWIEIRGARYKSMENFTFDQQTPEPMMIPISLACDGIYLRSLLL